MQAAIPTTSWMLENSTIGQSLIYSSCGVRCSQLIHIANIAFLCKVMTDYPWIVVRLRISDGIME